MTPSEIHRAAIAIAKMRQTYEQEHARAAAIRTRKRLEDRRWQAFLQRLLADPLTTETHYDQG